MPRFLIWDLPTRLFHWLLAGGFVAAFCIAQFTGKHSSFFPYHGMIGLLLAGMVLLRIAWGVVGTRYARFTSFVHGPGAVIEYLKNVITGQPTRHVGHNPASSWAIYVMLLLVLLIVASGILMDRAEAFEEIHSVAVYVLLAVAAVHVIGVILHTLRMRENITRSMIDGKKEVDPAHAIASASPLAGVTFAVLVVLFAAGLIRNFNASTRQTSLPLIGTAIVLGEAERAAERGEAVRHHEKREDHDD